MFLLCAAYEHLKYLVSILQCLDNQNTLVLIFYKGNYREKYTRFKPKYTSIFGRLYCKDKGLKKTTSTAVFCQFIYEFF